jgi:hypothetical protein
MYTHQHATSVTIHNPSANTPLTVSLQGRQAPEMKRHYEYTEDSRVGEIRPNGNGSIGGGQVTWSRRFVLVADRPTTVLVTSRSSNFTADELKRDADVWEVARELPAAREGVNYELDSSTRVAIAIDGNDESLDDAYVNLRQIGDANIYIIQQERRPVYKRARAASWLQPAIAGTVSPGASRDFTVNDTSRLLIESTAEEPTELVFANTNQLHALHLFTVDKDGERIASVVLPRAPVDNAAQWVLSGLNSGRVLVSKNSAAAVAQAPQ